MVYNKITKNETTKKERKDVMKKRKLMALLLAGGMVTSMLAGCGNGTESAGNDQSAGTEEEESSQDNENEGKVLTMMTYIDPNGGDATQEKVWEVYQRFTEETGIEIELNVVPWDQTESKVVITNQAGSPCDIALISSQKMPSLVNSGALLETDRSGRRKAAVYDSYFHLYAFPAFMGTADLTETPGRDFYLSAEDFRQPYAGELSVGI